MREIINKNNRKNKKEMEKEKENNLRGVYRKRNISPVNKNYM